MKSIGLLCSIGAIVVCAAAASSIKVVDTGYRGIKTRFGKVIGESLPEGFYMYNPLTTEIHNMDTKVQKYTLKMSTYTKDVQQASLVIKFICYFRKSEPVMPIKSSHRKFPVRLKTPSVNGKRICWFQTVKKPPMRF